MRSTSSRRSALALLLCGTLLVQGSLAEVCQAAERGPEPALLLKFVSPEVPEGTARVLLDPLPERIARQVDVRWVPAPEEPPQKPAEPKVLPIPDGAAIRGIADKVSEAAHRMEQVENRQAAQLLEEAERDARGYRFDEAIRPFLAEMFLRKGILKVREGDGAAAESFFARSRALRPEFVPDPGIFPPQVLAAWERASRRPVPEAELLVESLPSGAQIHVDGERRGTTPGRIRIGKPGPHQIRVAYPGYRDSRRFGQWLPGDSEMMGFTLEEDRMARLGEILGRDGDGAGSGSILSEIAGSAGVGRVAVLVLDKGKTGGELRLRLYARTPAGGDPALAGEREVAPDRRSAESVGPWVADRLIASEWPPVGREDSGKAWYNTWWFWAAVVSAAVGVAAAIGGGGGGGGSGSGTGSIAVNF